MGNRAVLEALSPREWLLGRERNFDLGKAARRSRIHSSHNPFNMKAQRRPLLIADHDECYFPALHVLLIAYVFIGRQQNLEPRGLRRRYQFAVH